MAEDPKSVLLVFNKSTSSFTAYPWMLARGGRCKVDVLARRDHPVGLSKWIREHILFDAEEELLPQLKGRLERGNYDAMLMIDESTRNLVLPHRHDPILAAYMPFPVESPLNEACMQKTLFHEWCRANEIPCPESRIVRILGEAISAAEDIGFPLILKGSFGNRGLAVFIVENERELEEHIKSETSQAEWLVQEFVHGEVGSTSFVAREGKVYAACSSYKHISLRGGLGPSSIRRFVASTALEQITRTVAEAGKISGITGFDWMEAGPGSYKVIDPHLGRGTTSVVASDRDGVDMGEAFYASLIDGEVQPAQEGSGKIVWMMPQSISLTFQGWLFKGLRRANPLSSKVSVFWYGKKEGRLFRAMVVPLIIGQLRVMLGHLRRVVTGQNK
ncbi:hypothetical protein DDZ13_06715 [Coraliomargarita sinensis]|uniref:ATP-grasp domain-containing protein n=1 Tax=Coraliomargarita sinensis TaxID=2174842 RepID=A0A317ZFH3_9BACT|nr:ATP-grasp domain-containing protein [Coraliomargarita sinensis]PXA04226.1 hypothetical protein DDZ13_06715 [Coraliomargarita sinensis]